MSRICLGAAACAVAAACGSSTPTTTTPPPPPVVQYLYVGDDASSGSLRAYALPLSATSTPTAAVPMPNPFLIGVNATGLAVATLNDTVAFFHLPLTSSSASYAVIAAGSDGTPLFGQGDSLYQGGNNAINVYLSPFSDGQTPVRTISTPGLSPADLAADPTGTVYETSGGNTIGVISGDSLITTLTAAAGTQFRGLAASGTTLFACGFNGSSNNVYLYSLPLSTTSMPIVTIPMTSTPEGCAIDSNNNLYVGSPSGQITVFAPPLNNGSTPALVLTTPAVIFGLAVGP